MSNKTPKAVSAKIASAPSLYIAGLILAVILVAAVLWAVTAGRNRTAYCQINPELETIDMQIGSEKFIAEVARSGSDQARGLSGRDCLDDGRAMLFPYDRPGDYCFWMKDMNFAIDMIWLDDDKKIVTVEQAVQPDSYPESFCPERPAQYVVEVPAGTAGRLQLTSSQHISF